MLRLILCTVLLFQFSIQDDCTDQTCTDGIPISQLSKSLRNAVAKNKLLPHNVLRFVSWNLKEFSDGEKSWDNRGEELCKKLRSLRATTFGFQGVNANILKKLKLCLRRFAFTSDEKSPKNVIAYKRTRYLRRQRHGQYLRSNSSNSTKDHSETCVWSKMVYATVIGKKMVFMESMKSRMLRLLSDATKTRPPRRRQGSRRAVNTYRWHAYFVVNAAFHHDNEEMTSSNMQKCLDFMYNNVMRRRRYPLVMMKSFDDKEKEDLMKTASNHVFELQSDYSETEHASHENKASIVYKGFKGIISATIIDDVFGENKPVFAAVVGQRRS